MATFNIKKILFIVVSCCLLFATIACGGKNSDSGKETPNSQSSGGGLNIGDGGEIETPPIEF